MTVAELIEMLTDLDKLDAVVVVADQDGTGDMILGVDYDHGIVTIDYETQEEDTDV